MISPVKKAPKHNRLIKPAAHLAQPARSKKRASVDVSGIVQDLQKTYAPDFDWVTDREIRSVGKQLLQLKNKGIEFEKGRDFLASGRIAFKIREILHEIKKAAREFLEQ